MHRKLILMVLFAGIFTLIIVIGIILKKGNIQTCTYQDDKRKMTVQIPKEWTYKINNQFKGDSSIEGLPDVGIDIYIDGDADNNVYFFYQDGTLIFDEPGMLIDQFETYKGQSGTLYKVNHNNTTRIITIFDIGHYAITTGLTNEEYELYEKEIFRMLKSCWIEEF